LRHLNWSCQEAVRDWTNRNHTKKSGNLQQDSKQGTYTKALCRRTKDLLKLNRYKLGWVVGLFTGHWHLKGHPFKQGLTDDPTCERCLEEDESATHILWDCKAIANLKFRHQGQFFIEPSDWLLWRPYKQSPTFHSRYRINKGLIKGEAQ
jgi:hypothetical protein